LHAHAPNRIRAVFWRGRIGHWDRPARNPTPESIPNRVATEEISEVALSLCAKVLAAAHEWFQVKGLIAAKPTTHVRYRGHTGKHMLVLSFTGFDPERTLNE
jgi:hypothetical protein